ncbi:MAG: ESX secretion-associated protein EspG, partial [Nocardia sp.]|nr:ESX secretion-associated protein EspG [Nocardia sp.]
EGIQREYRIIGARTDHHAAILHQFTQAGREGLFRLRLCRSENLPVYLSKTIPARSPGKQQPLTVHPADLRANHQSLTGNTPAERYRRLFESHGEGGGLARLLIGPFNTDPAPTRSLHWHDLKDGRYLELRSENITVRPVAPTDIATRFTTWIEAARKRIREDEEEYETW